MNDNETDNHNYYDSISSHQRDNIITKQEMRKTILIIAICILFIILMMLTFNIIEIDLNGCMGCDMMRGGKIKMISKPSLSGFKNVSFSGLLNSSKGIVKSGASLVLSIMITLIIIVLICMIFLPISGIIIIVIICIYILKPKIAYLKTL